MPNIISAAHVSHKLLWRHGGIRDLVTQKLIDLRRSLRSQAAIQCYIYLAPHAVDVASADGQLSRRLTAVCVVMLFDPLKPAAEIDRIRSRLAAYIHGEFRLLAMISPRNHRATR